MPLHVAHVRALTAACCLRRVYPDGKVQYMHPADGVYPEKVNAGRIGVNQNFRRIGENLNPIKVKFTGKGPAEF